MTTSTDAAAGRYGPLAERPGKVIAVHINYPSRAAQRGRTPAEPSYFLKPSTSLSPSGAAIERPDGTELLAFEGEIAIVIGAEARRVTPDDAWAHVSHVTASNDFGAYDLRWADKGSNLRSKGGDGFTPIGPALLDARAIDPAALRLRTWVNGNLVQDDSTATLLFPLPLLVADLSQLVTLEPGDVILTGTPAGASVVQPGDVVEVEVDVPGGPSTGRLVTPVVQGTAPIPPYSAQPKVDDDQRAEAWGSREAAGLAGDASSRFARSATGTPDPGDEASTGSATGTSATGTPDPGDDASTGSATGTSATGTADPVPEPVEGSATGTADPGDDASTGSATGTSATGTADPVPEPVEGSKRGLSDELRAKLEAVPVAGLSAQLRKRGLDNVTIDGVRANRPGTKLVGLAKTLRFVPGREDLFASHGGGYNAQKRAFDAVEPGEVIVIEARGERGSGTLGDVLALRAHARGAAGIVTDGGVRDYDTVAGIDIPVFSSGPHPAVLGRKHVPWDVDVTIGCGGTTVQPGDVIVGDGDGVIVIPPGLVEEVVDAALAQEDEDAYVAEQVGAGHPVDGLFPMNDEWKARYAAWRQTR